MITTMTREEKVREFREAAGKRSYMYQPEDLEVIFRGVGEEFLELIEATKDHITNRTVETRANLCKEWADLAYVVSQAAVYFDIPGDESFNRVHESNMTKVVDGKVTLREDGKILKPDTYKAPDMRGL